MRLLLLCLLLTLPAFPQQLPYTPGDEEWVLLSPDGRRVLVNGHTKVTVWDIPSRRLIHTFKNLDNVLAYAFSPDGRYVALSDTPRWIGYFDLDQGGKRVWDFKAPWGGPTKMWPSAGAYLLHFSPEGKYLLAVGADVGRGYADNLVRLFSAADGRILQTFPQNTLYRPFDFVGGGLVGISAKNKLGFYSLPSGTLQKQVTVPKIFAVETNPRGVRVSLTGGLGKDPVYSVPDLAPVEISLSDEATASNGSLSWERKDGKLTVRNGQHTVYQATEEARVRAWVPGGGFLIAGEKLEIYDADGKELNVITNAVSISEKANFASTNPGYGGPMDFYDLVTGKQIGHLDYVNGQSFSKDGSRFATLTKKGVLIIDVDASLQQGKLVPL